MREFGMCAIANGMALHGGVIPYVGTFTRVQRLRAQRRAHGCTDETARALHLHHDSIGVGAKTADHQPVERGVAAPDPRPQRLAPADFAGKRRGLRQRYRAQDGPTMLCLSRQNTAVIARDASHEALIRRGGYIVSKRKRRS